MVLDKPGTSLQFREMPTPIPTTGEIRVVVSACGVCRTDLHVVDGELPNAKFPIIPGHEIIGHIDAIGPGINDLKVGMRVGIPWLAKTCGECPFCRSSRENLCDAPLFTGYTRDGGYATHAIADGRFTFALPEGDDIAQAPLLCAGLIGWRSLRLAGDGPRVGLYGFGAAAHIVAQIAIWQNREIYAFTRTGDHAAQAFARQLGACWSGGSEQLPPEPLDCAIIYAPIGALVPTALSAVRKGGRVVCAGIHMSDIPSFPYNLLWEERELLSVANLTRNDGIEFFEAASKIGIVTKTLAYPLSRADDALSDLRAGRIQGAAVVVP
jgi:propanol-preferring alcohol dehydrogenase